MSTTSIFVCRDPRESHWQLGALPPQQGLLTLIGWRRVAESADAGVPAEVAAVIARALTATTRITFPTSTKGASAPAVWTAAGGDLLREVAPHGLAGHASAALKRHPRKVVLVSTRQPATARALFDDAAYPWWLQGQVVMMSAADAAPPDVDLETLFSLFEDDWTRSAASLAAHRIEGLMRPGVDGDLAGVVSLSSISQQSFLGALEAEARRAGLDWAAVDEHTFAGRYAQ